MKIVHLCLGNYFADGFGYQENMLTKQHKKMGMDVEVIASVQSFGTNGKIVFSESPGSYINDDGVTVTRIPYRKNNKFYHKYKRYIGTYEALENSAPDILFIHNCQFMDIDRVVKYLKRHTNVVVYVDNHADFANSATRWVSRYLVHGFLWKHCARRILPYARRFYGLQPARVSFLQDVYGIPESKCQLLVVGGDDELIEHAKQVGTRTVVREKHRIGNSDFVIVTGGKINRYRPETISLMRAVCEINRENLKVLIFGTVADELKVAFERLSSNPHIVYAGWIPADETYNYIEASDLVCFPGLHSVMWEQAVAQGKPCIFRDLEGFHHVDIGGNADFVSDVSVEGLKKALLGVIDNPDHYNEMKTVAEEKGMKAFSYRDIARRSIEQ